MSWVCPHCGTTATLSNADIDRGWTSAMIGTAPDDEGIAIGWAAVKCPSHKCGEYVLDIETRFGSAKNNVNGYRTGEVKPDRSRKFGIGEVRIEPRIGLPLSKYVPDVVKQDYEEACLIKDLSPKASATLCRRALQGMIRHYWNVTKPTLHEELAAIKAQCEPELFDAMMSLKSIGNIGAHPEKDINLIVDIEEGEPDALLVLLQILDKDWYVAKADRLSRLSIVKKLGDAKTAAKAATGGCPNFCVRGAERLVHGAGRRLRRTTGAVVKSVLILCDHFGKPLCIQNRELIHRRFPVFGRSAPIGRDVSQRQPNQLGGRVITGEVTPRLDDLAQL